VNNISKYRNTEWKATIERRMRGRGPDLEPHFHVEVLFGNGLAVDGKYQRLESL
jgi:hypothetical protein